MLDLAPSPSWKELSQEKGEHPSCGSPLGAQSPSLAQEATKTLARNWCFGDSGSMRPGSCVCLVWLYSLEHLTYGFVLFFIWKTMTLTNTHFGGGL